LDKVLNLPRKMAHSLKQNTMNHCLLDVMMEDNMKKGNMLVFIFASNTGLEIRVQ
jgi:hypothetical protein